LANDKRKPTAADKARIAAFVAALAKKHGVPLSKVYPDYPSKEGA